jgi:glycosyltransferase involved in cell wall biosynthesis
VECAKKLSIRSMIKVEDIAFERPKNVMKKMQRSIEQRSNAKALNAADQIFVVNRYVAKQAQELYGVAADKIIIAPNGVNIDRFRVNRKGDPGKTVVFTGVMYYHRGLDFLIENASQIIEQNSDVKFRLVGAGPEKDKLQKLVSEKKIGQYFEFTGWVGWHEIPQILADAAIGLGPLKRTDVTRQAIPIKVLEYMASGLPVVALTETLPNDVLRHMENGYHVSDGEDFVEKVTKLLKDKDLNINMGVMSREIVEKEFDWKIVVGKMFRNYKTRM